MFYRKNDLIIDFSDSQQCKSNIAYFNLRLACENWVQTATFVEEYKIFTYSRGNGTDGMCSRTFLILYKKNKI